MTDDKLKEIQTRCKRAIRETLSLRDGTPEKALETYFEERRNFSEVIKFTYSSSPYQKTVFKWAKDNNLLLAGNERVFEMKVGVCQIHVGNDFFYIRDLARYGNRIARRYIREFNINVDLDHVSERFSEFLEEMQEAEQYINTNYSSFAERKERNAKKSNVDLGIIEAFLESHFNDRGIRCEFSRGKNSSLVSFEAGKFTIRYRIYSGKVNCMQEELEKIDKLLDAFLELKSTVAVKKNK